MEAGEEDRTGGGWTYCDAGGRIDSRLLRKEPGREPCPLTGGEDGVGRENGPEVEETAGLYGSYGVDAACVGEGTNWLAGGGCCANELVGLYGSWGGTTGFGGEANLSFAYSRSYELVRECEEATDRRSSLGVFVTVTSPTSSSFGAT